MLTDGQTDKRSFRRSLRLRGSNNILYKHNIHKSLYYFIMCVNLTSDL